MKKRNFARDTIIVGLALFATMFGAGNLIFPPQIGLFSGSQWVLGALGLLFGGIILPVLALWAVNNVGEDAKDLMRHVSPWCYNLYYLIGCSLIAMGSTLPRSAATTHEMAIQPLFPGVPIWITVIVFFALVYFFACDPNSVIDKLGKYMTPLFLLVIYPSTIVMTVLGLLNNFLPNDGPYKGGVLMAAVVSLGDAVLSVNPNIGWLQDLMAWFPLSGMGFSWLVPAIIGAVVGTLICRGRPKYQPALSQEETTQS